MQVQVLVADDSRPLREFVVEALAAREGYSVVEAVDGAQALERILSDPPDLALLDLEMPHLRGTEVLDALRERGSNVPVILMTSHGSEVIAVEMFRKGVRDYLIKPFTAEELFDALERALAEVRLRQEREALRRHLETSNKELQRRVQEAETLYQVGKSITSLQPRDQVLERIMDAVFYLVGAEEAALMLSDRETGRMQAVIHRQRVPGELDQGGRRSEEELAQDAASKGDVTASGALLYAPLKVGEEVIGAIGVGNRVSARPFSPHSRQLLRALADYAAIAIENARLYEEVQQANRAKSEFVSVVAHELRAPMTSIHGYTSMLRQGLGGELTPTQAEFITAIDEVTERMRVLVSDLADVSRIEAGRLRMEPRPVKFQDALLKAAKTVRTSIESRSQRLTLQVPDDLPLVQADPNRLVQILTNLLSNATKYTPDEGGIRVEVGVEGDHVRCAVSDTGIGMSPEDLERLFTKFFRSDHPHVREVPGTGLGLVIVKNLVELQGGEVEVASELGRGTRVSFTLPVVKETGRQGNK